MSTSTSTQGLRGSGTHSSSPDRAMRFDALNKPRVIIDDTGGNSSFNTDCE